MNGQGGLVGKVVATIALLAIGTAMGYSMGVQRGIESSREQKTNLSVDPAVIGVLEEAARRARDSGDELTAQWIDESVKTNRQRILEWSESAARNGQGRPEVRRVNASAGN